MPTWFYQAFIRLKPFWKNLTGAAIAVAALVATWSQLEWLVPKAQAWLSIGISPGATPVVSQAVAQVVVVGAVAFATVTYSTVLFGVMLLRRKRVHRELRQLRKKEVAIKSAMHNVGLICNQLYPALSTPPYAWEEMDIVVTVDRNGDAWIRRRDAIRAVSDPVPYWHQWISAEAEAPGQESLEDLGFSIQDISKTTKVAHLLMENGSHLKRVAVFHLPVVDSAEPDARVVETKFTWPRMLQHLLTAGSERWSWVSLSAKPVGRVRMAFWFHPSLGNVRCEYVGRAVAGARLSSESLESGWPGWVFECKDGPTGTFSYAFQLTRSEGSQKLRQ